MKQNSSKGSGTTSEIFKERGVTFAEKLHLNSEIHPIHQQCLELKTGKTAINTSSKEKTDLKEEQKSILANADDADLIKLVENIGSELYCRLQFTIIKSLDEAIKNYMATENYTSKGYNEASLFKKSGSLEEAKKCLGEMLTEESLGNKLTRLHTFIGGAGSWREDSLKTLFFYALDPSIVTQIESINTFRNKPEKTRELCLKDFFTGILEQCEVRPVDGCVIS